MTLNYDRLPEELRWNRQWCLAGPDDTRKYKAPYALGPRGLFRIKPTVPDHWKDLETTIEAATLCPPCGIGFVLSQADLFTCIDLDVKNAINYPNNLDHNGKFVAWTTPEEIARFHRIIESFNSYTERSASGQGYHIWVRGKIGEGVRRDGVEVYSQERFIVCTGDVFLDRDIEPRQELLDLLVAEIKQNSAQTHVKQALVEVAETESDNAIFERARDADNADKFVTLCNGDWSGYPSQSEADLALLSIFAFYTKSNEQCRRLFRATKLGERVKATKNDVHIDRMLTLVRSRQAAEESVEINTVALSNSLLATIRPQPVIPPLAKDLPSQAFTKEILFPEQLPEHNENIARPDEEFNEDFFNAAEGSVDWPPGIVGRIAKYIFAGSPRPVKEVSIVGALGFCAGICGKAFTIPQSGLNLYIVLVARSAIGKEAMHSGIANLIKNVCDEIPEGMCFVDFSDYASGPALTKAVATNPCFVNVSGEWGRKLRRLGQEDGRDGPMQQLRTVMTNLYQKSGPKAIVGGLSYSDKEKNVSSISGIAYSMIGETTPQTFYDALTPNMMEDGFLSRFTVVEYGGDRPPANKVEPETIAPDLIATICDVVRQALKLNDKFQNQPVSLSTGANEMLDEFDRECDFQVNKTKDEGWRQMWNRAHLKAYRIAAILAVFDNYLNPVITTEHTEWALDLIKRDIKIMRSRIADGDIGSGDDSRQRKLLKLMKHYLTNSLPASYDIPSDLHKDGIIPRKYLQINTQRTPAFSTARNGQNNALDGAIKSLIDSGYLAEVTKDKLANKYKFHGKAYLIVSIN